MKKILMIAVVVLAVFVSIQFRVAVAGNESLVNRLETMMKELEDINDLAKKIDWSEYVMREMIKRLEDSLPEFKAANDHYEIRVAKFQALSDEYSSIWNEYNSNCKYDESRTYCYEKALWLNRRANRMNDEEEEMDEGKSLLDKEVERREKNKELRDGHNENRKEYEAEIGPKIKVFISKYNTLIGSQQFLYIDKGIRSANCSRQANADNLHRRMKLEEMEEYKCLKTAYDSLSKKQ